MITPNSYLVGRNVQRGKYLSDFGFQLLAVSRNNKPLLDNEITIKAGDAFLVRGTWESIDKLKDHFEN